MHVHRLGPQSQRPSSVLFETWKQSGIFYQTLEQTKIMEQQQQVNQIGKEQKQDDSTSKVINKVVINEILPLSIFQLSDKEQMRNLFQVIHLFTHLVLSCLCLV